MTANDKELIYNLLKTASGAINGYTTAAFKAEKPEFSDDVTASKVTQTDILTSQEKTETVAAKSQSLVADNTQIKSSVSIASISEKIAQCNRCILCKTRKNVVPGTGIEKPLVLVIGEGPGAEEDNQGLPFVGAAGQLLDKMLSAISLSRKQNCYIANVVKCRPPQNRDPSQEEICACYSFLEAQINILKPKMILLMGRIAAQTVLKSNSGINTLRGRFSTINGIPVMATYHPSALLRNVELKAPAWADLKTFRLKLLELSPDYEKSFVKE